MAQAFRAAGGVEGPWAPPRTLTHARLPGPVCANCHRPLRCPVCVSWHCGGLLFLKNETEGTCKKKKKKEMKTADMARGPVRDEEARARPALRTPRCRGECPRSRCLAPRLGQHEAISLARRVHGKTLVPGFYWCRQWRLSGISLCWGFQGGIRGATSALVAREVHPRSVFIPSACHGAGNICPLSINGGELGSHGSSHQGRAPQAGGPGRRGAGWQ